MSPFISPEETRRSLEEASVPGDRRETSVAGQTATTVWARGDFPLITELFLTVLLSSFNFLKSYGKTIVVKVNTLLIIFFGKRELF